MKRKLVVLGLSVLLTFVLADVVLRFFVVHSDRAWGELFEVKLPPEALLPWEQIKRDEKTEGLVKPWSVRPSPVVVRGTRLAWGDLNGILREDPLLGHAPKENSVSVNGWWQANNYGARSSRDIRPENPAHELRLFVFGGSYAHGSRVPEGETWCSFLEAEDERLQVWSFGVDGYGMGQSYLRFQQVAAELDYDLALLVWVPDKSLWRDINLIRYVGHRWESYKINPRFVVEEGELRLVPSPYEDLKQMTERNREGISDELREHLRKYEGFYIPSKYEEVPLLGRSILFKRLLAWRIERREDAIDEGVMRPGSDAQRLSKKIFEAMSREVEQQGREFALLILPSRSALKAYREQPDRAEQWEATVRFVCEAEYPCYDVMREFADLPAGSLDRGYDHSHFGPRTNRRIARFVQERIVSERLDRLPQPGAEARSEAAALE